ncbi:GNAT family N-acetyltransferase [Microbacterium saccharophilum]|uniref:GNAT family N-acetyltransferase n=1 Tax=Microbacterium saccharophilum TaxID=1213358 RepID=A0A5C8I884_9MICO|nr:GNAT family N-acetyltransferase [Microbacterium saccharophilum]GEP47408.1 N-acetyltransferase [Microbacterium saccharophilum]
MDAVALPWDFRPLDGERVRLTALRQSDLDPLYAMQSDPDVCRYLLYEPRSRDQVVDVLARDAGALRLENAGDYLQPAIRDREGRFLGTMYLELHSVEDRTAEIGWILLPEHQGHGYAQEAATVLLDLCFGELGLHRVYAELDPRNTASVALCTRLGMREEGLFREHMWLKGEWTDTGHHAILEREWAARR